MNLKIGDVSMKLALPSPTVNEGSQLVERLGLPTCTCPRSSNDRSQSLHLGGRFSLHIRNGQWGSAKPCKIMQKPLSFTRTSENFMPVPFGFEGVHLTGHGVSSLAPKLAGFHHGQKPLGAPECQRMPKLHLCRFHFHRFHFLKVSINSFLHLTMEGSKCTCLAQDLSWHFLSIFLQIFRKPSKHRYCEAPILPGK